MARTPDEMLIKAARDGDLPGIEGALEAGASVDARSRQEGMTPLMFAAWSGESASVELLLGKGANPDLFVDEDEAGDGPGQGAGVWGRAIWFAAGAGSMDCYRMLSAASRPDKALIQACKENAGVRMGREIEAWENFERDRQAVEEASLQAAASPKSARL